MSRQMTIERRPVGVVDTRPVEAFTLANGAGLHVEVWSWGATLVEVRTPGRDGRLANVVLRLPDLATYRDRARNPYVGSTIGRYCRCVADGRLLLNGTRYQLDRNDGRHHVHGGGEGFDRRVWAAEAGRDGDAVAVTFTLDSPDGDQGYPGALRAECTYRVDDADRLTIEYRATTSATTVVGLTNHAFWNLAGHGTVDSHLLRLNADRFVPFDEDLIPLPGPPRPVADGPLDYRRPRVLGSAAIDNFFPLDDPSLAAELHHPDSGRLLRVTTDEPGIGVYTGDGYPTPRAGICLETGAWPDAPNRPDFPSVVLEPHEVYHRRTTYAFRVV